MRAKGNKDLDIQPILDQLLKKYGTLRKAAGELNYSESNLKAMIRNMSDKTRLKLDEVGIKIDNSTVNNHISGGDNSMNLNGRDLTKNHIEEKNTFKCAFNMAEMQEQIGKVIDKAVAAVEKSYGLTIESKDKEIANLNKIIESLLKKKG